MINAIEVKALSKSFGKENVLTDINVSFETGKIHGIIGRNGSGKTVFMKCILGFLKPEYVLYRKRCGFCARYRHDD